MCMTDDGDALLETARRIQAERKPKYTSAPDEVDVALGRLMAAIEDMESAKESWGYESLEFSEAARIVLAGKRQYDAARLAKGDRTMPVFRLDVQGDELADGIGGEIG